MGENGRDDGRLEGREGKQLQPFRLGSKMEMLCCNSSGTRSVV